VKAGVEQAKGFRPAMQELFRYDEAWTGTLGSGGSGHSAAQEDAALVEEGYEFEGPCSLLVSVNESYAVVLEGQEEGEFGHTVMGVYERVENKEVDGKGVWQAVGCIGRSLYYHSFLRYDSSNKQWLVSDRKTMEADNASCAVYVRSTAATPDQITEQWRVYHSTAFVNTPNLRVRVCSSVEKHTAEQRVEQEQVQALKQAHDSCRLMVEGLANDRNQMMGAYELMEGKVVSGRAVWQKQKQGGGREMFLYYSSKSSWYFSERENMETGISAAFMSIISAALTPDQTRPSEVWEVHDGTQWVANPEVGVRRQQQ
jgi:hypothetical protein